MGGSYERPLAIRATEKAAALMARPSASPDGEVRAYSRILGVRWTKAAPPHEEGRRRPTKYQDSLGGVFSNPATTVASLARCRRRCVRRFGQLAVACRPRGPHVGSLKEGPGRNNEPDAGLVDIFDSTDSSQVRWDLTNDALHNAGNEIMALSHGEGARRVWNSP